MVKGEASSTDASKRRCSTPGGGNNRKDPDGEGEPPRGGRPTQPPESEEQEYDVPTEVQHPRGVETTERTRTVKTSPPGGAANAATGAVWS